MERTGAGRPEGFEPNEATLAALCLQELYRQREPDGIAIEEAARTVFEQTYPRLYGGLFNEVRGDEAAAQDVLQMSYERAFRAFKHGKFRGDSQVDTWLHAIAANKAKDYLAKKGRRERYEANVDVYDEDPGSPIDIEKLVLDRVVIEKIDRFLATLSEQNRVIWRMRYIENRHHDEIRNALIVGGLGALTIGAIRVRTHRLNNYVKKLVEESS